MAAKSHTINSYEQNVIIHIDFTNHMSIVFRSLSLSPAKETYFSFCLKWSLLFCSFYNLKLSLSLSIFLLNLDKSPAKISVFFFFRPGEEKKTRKQSHINKKLERDWKEKHFKYYVVWRNMNDQAQHRVFKRHNAAWIYI